VTASAFLQRPLVQRLTLIGAAAVLVAALFVLMSRAPLDPAAGEARLEVDGVAIVDRVDGGSERVTDQLLLREGDRVASQQGSMRLVLSDGAVLEGRAGSDAEPTVVEVGEVPELLDGELLAEATTGVVVAAAGNEISLAPGPGAMRVARSLAVDTTTYAGTVPVDSAGQRRVVGAYRRLSVSVLGSPPSRPRPMGYDASDPWDQRYLGEWIDLGERLRNLVGAYSATIRPGEGRTPGFFRLVLPALAEESQFTPDLLSADREPGETLVGAAITQLGTEGTFRERWRSVFEFRDEGAEWGLVAADQQVEGEPLVAGLEAALNASPFEFTAAAGDVTATTAATGTTTGAGSTPAGTAPGTPGATTGGGGTGGGGGAPSGGGGSGPLPPPPTTPPPPPTTLPPPPEDPIGDLVEGVGDLIGGLLPPGP
jgi:hypothetical protein